MNKLIKRDLFTEGIIWNFISYVFLAVFTVIAYMLITFQYGPAQLGAYNIVMSLFMVLGHLGVWGLQTGAVYTVPRLKDNKIELGKWFSSNIIIVLCMSVCVSTILFFMAGFIGRKVFNSLYVLEGIKKISIALPIFCINKLLAGVLNGLNEMKRYALLQGVRYAFIVFYLIIACVFRFNFTQALLAFLGAELSVFILGIMFLKNLLSLGRIQKQYVIAAFSFGGKAVFGNVINDINTRIDMMMLGILCNEEVVGLYAYITLIIEGMFSVLLVFKNNYNPIISESLYCENKKKLAEVFYDINVKIRSVIALLAIAVTIAYALFVLIFLPEEYKKTICALIIIQISIITVCSSYILGSYCTMSGKPIIDTAISVVSILINVTFNYVLIQYFALYGAAIATAISYGCFGFFVQFAIGRIKK